MSQFNSNNKKIDNRRNTGEIGVNSLSSNTIVSLFPKKLVHVVGREVLEVFLNSLPYFQIQGNIKSTIGTLLDQSEKWYYISLSQISSAYSFCRIQFIQNSLTDYMPTE